MRLGFVSSFKAGMDGHATCIISELKKKIKVVTIGNQQSKCDYKIDLSSFRLKEMLNKIISKEKLDIIEMDYIAPHFGVLFGKYAHNIGLIHALPLRVPLVVTLHEVQYPHRGLISKLKRTVPELLEQKVVQSADWITVPIESQKSFIEKKYNKKNVSHIPFVYGTRKSKKQHKKGKNLLFFGLIGPNKGIEYLIEAMKHLNGYKLTIAGNTHAGIPIGYANSLISLIKKNGLKNIKTEFGWISEEKKREYFNNADAMVLPFIHAPWQSGVALEAMINNIPLVITKGGYSWEVVAKYQAGEVIEPANKEAIANGVKRLFKNYKKYKTGILRFNKEINPLTIANKHLEVYKRVLNSRKG